MLEFSSLISKKHQCRLVLIFLLQRNKAICDYPTANVILNSEKLKVFLLKITNKTSRSTFTIIQYSTKSPSKSQLGKKKEIKGTQTGKEELKLFADDMTLHAATNY